MLDLWEALSVELGSAFIRQFGSSKESTFEHWLQELWGFSSEDIFKGLERFKQAGKTYISLNVFRAHCQARGAARGLPDLNQAYRLVMARAWEDLHPAFQHIAQERVTVKEEFLRAGKKFKVQKLKYDFAAMRAMKEFDSLRAFRPYFDEVNDRVASGESFERIESLEHDPKTPRSEESIKRSIQAGRSTLSDLLSGLKARS